MDDPPGHSEKMKKKSAVHVHDHSSQDHNFGCYEYNISEKLYDGTKWKRANFEKRLYLIGPNNYRKLVDVGDNMSLQF